MEILPRLRSTLGLAVLFGLAVGVPLWPQAPAAPVASGSVSGHVYRSDTGAPLTEAMVTLWDLPPHPNGFKPFQHVRTQADGSYQFTSVEAGSYGLFVAHAGFVRITGGRTVSVGPGQLVGNRDFRLVQTAAISGSVHDQYDQPIEEAQVTVYCKDENGQFGSPVNGDQVRTDDRGNFRAYDVSPGDCYVQAVVSTLSGPGQPPTVYSVYYPNAESPDQAKILPVKPGVEIPDIHFTINVPY